MPPIDALNSPKEAESEVREPEPQLSDPPAADASLPEKCANADVDEDALVSNGAQGWIF